MGALICTVEKSVDVMLVAAFVVAVEIGSVGSSNMLGIGAVSATVGSTVSEEVVESVTVVVVASGRATPPPSETAVVDTISGVVVIRFT